MVKDIQLEFFGYIAAIELLKDRSKFPNHVPTVVDLGVSDYSLIKTVNPVFVKFYGIHRRDHKLLKDRLKFTNHVPKIALEIAGRVSARAEDVHRKQQIQFL